MDRFGVGIIGCGAVAQEYIKAFEADERSHVRALVSLNRTDAQRYRDRYDLDCVIETDADGVLALGAASLRSAATKIDERRCFLVYGMDMKNTNRSKGARPWMLLYNATSRMSSEF